MYVSLKTRVKVTNTGNLVPSAPNRNLTQLLLRLNKERKLVSALTVPKSKYKQSLNEKIQSNKRTTTTCE